MRRSILFIACLLGCVIGKAQTPKWAHKARKAVFSIVTYDKNNHLLGTGSGFFIDEEGTAISDYALFERAERAIVINSEGKEMPVKNILGANDMYNAVKFRVETNKKTPALILSSVTPVKGDQLYLLPYSSQKKQECFLGTIHEISIIPGGFKYYTLQMEFNPKSVGCPLINAQGEVVALLQESEKNDKGYSYALDAVYAKELSISILSMNDDALNKIGIPKALPEKEDQAITYLYLSAGNKNEEEYSALIETFIEQFPDNPEGYMKRADQIIHLYSDDIHLAQADNDLKHALKLAKKKEDIYYNMSSIIYNYTFRNPSIPYKDWGYEKALTEIRHALALDSLPLYRQQEGDILFAMKDYANACKSYSIVNQSNLASPLTLYNEAKCKEQMGAEYTVIIALMDSAIHFYPEPLPAEAAPLVYERAQLKIHNEQFRSAVADFNLYEQLVNGQANDLFFYEREQAEYKAKMFKQALEDIQTAVKMKPENPVYLAELGAVNLRIGQYKTAIDTLQKAIDIDPSFASCYRLIGFCQMQLGQKEEACQNFNKARELGDEVVLSLIERNCR